MRACLLLVSVMTACTRPNPLFGASDGDGSSSGDTLGASTGGSSSTATGPVPTSSSTSGETGETGETGAATGPDLPACLLSDRRVIFDPPLPMDLCGIRFEAYAATTKIGDAGFARLCSLKDCQEPCLPEVPLGTDLSPLVGNDACYRIVHQGVWAPGDPEAPSGCKTAAVAIYEGTEQVYPIYAGFSRVLDPPPMFLDPDIAIAGEIAAKNPCTCGMNDCCADGDAETYSLDFTGAATFSLSPGDTQLQLLKGVLYTVSLLRAQTSGASDAQQVCQATPERALIDWQIFKPPLP